MENVCLQLYFKEFQKHKKKLLYEWILEAAKDQKVKGCSVFKATAGFGSHGKIYEEHFFELASETAIKMELFLSKEKANQFLDLLKNENISIFYTITKVEIGFLESS